MSPNETTEALESARTTEWSYPPKPGFLGRLFAFTGVGELIQSYYRAAIGSAGRQLNLDEAHYFAA